MGGAAFTWLHISDVHFNAKEEYARNVIADDLLASLTRGLKFTPINAVFFTGDLAFHGSAEEYDDHVQPFLDRLLKATGIPREHLFLVPGNHDVQRSRIRPYHKLGLIEHPDDTSGTALPDCDELFGDNPTLRLLAEKFAAFDAMARRYPGAWRNGRDAYTVYVVRVNGLRIGVVGLNSAWFVSGDDKPNADKTKLLLGRRLVNEALARLRTNKPDMTFVLMHHPLEWLCPWEQATVGSAVSGLGVAVLQGHLHKDYVEKVVTSGSGRLVARAGALYEKSKHPKSFILGRWEPDTGQLLFCPYKHVTASEARWVIDTEVFPEDEGGIGSFQGPKCEPTDLRLANTVGELQLKCVPGPSVSGSYSDPVGCVYIDGSIDQLKHVRSVTYCCLGGKYNGQRWVIRQRTDRPRDDRFAQPVPVKDPVLVEATIEFSDCSSRNLPRIEVCSLPAPP